MNNNYDITEEEFCAICHIIGGNAIKKYFKKNPIKFAKLKPGFRPEKMMYDEAIEMAIKFKDKPFIYTFVNNWIESEVKNIEECIANIYKEGLSYGESCAIVLMDSDFCDNIRLYFKLAGVPNEDAFFDLMITYIDEIKRRKDEYKDQENRINELNLYIESQKQSYQKIILEKDKGIKEKDERISLLETKLASEKDKMIELEQELSEKIKSNHNHRLIDRYDDNYFKSHLRINQNDYISICEVLSPDYNGRVWLKRVFDIDRNGHINKFHFDETKPSYYENRKQLYRNDGPDESGEFGVWEWYSEPNRKDPDKDVSKTFYRDDVNPIEVIILENCRSLDELSEYLKRGFEYKNCMRKLLIAIRNDKGNFSGVLCLHDEIKSQDGKIVLMDKVIWLPVYDFTYKEVLQLKSGIKIFNSVIMGKPESVYQVKETAEIVKEVVLSSISWDRYVQAGTVREGYIGLENLISLIKTESVTDEICRRCCCEGSTANRLLDEFIRNVCSNIVGESIEDNVIITALHSNEELMKRAKNLVRNEWELENQESIRDEEEKIKTIKNQVHQSELELYELNKRVDAARKEKKTIEESISEKKLLAENVEYAVQDRIRKAQGNVAEFIAEMAFMPTMYQNVQGDDACKSYSQKDKAIYKLIDMYLDKSDISEQTDWENVIEELADNLYSSGVKSDYTYGLAAYICAAFIEKQPIILIGPNADDIINACSAVLSNGELGHLCCGGEFQPELLDNIGANDERIVKITNVLSSKWISRLPELISNKEIFYIATHPYAEDVQVEPKGIYGYMLPLFTEFFVTRAATGEYYGCHISEDIAVKVKPEQRRITGLSALSVNMLTKAKIQQVVRTMYTIYDNIAYDDEFLFATFPLAYATLNVGPLIKKITKDDGELLISTGLKKDIEFVLREFI